ncbi:hypothetical protein [Mucilaginibacter celer]|uniref:PH domain-containing protein n=1 Tax=Mucilaginibacter celer TaxID=2305508 RepID=A0A494VV91_9SPHI|nr:hypothetical protein [Mucilaginibacter celer]AYL95353.1 hypothetical protein HYN43_008610 [Mucilaginibacter celer]
MLQLVSKLQHNTYEKGEFSDEQPRDLDETIRLIKDFPWDAERALTDIQLTGPSVTIQDNDLNYLKLGLFFNGKFCVYYLDNHNHLYEYHAPSIDEACNQIEAFFNQTLDLKSYEKHFFNIGNQPHFKTANFIYRVNPLKIFAMASGVSVYILSFIAFTSVGVFKPGDKSALNFSIVGVILVGMLIGYIFLRQMEGRHQYLQISRGKTSFLYGKDKEHIQTYDKLDIEVINYKVGNKGAITNIEIIFKDGRFIKPRHLIDGNTLLAKFPEKLHIRLNAR